MKLTLQQIEDVFLHSEKERLIEPCVWSILYIAARNGEIDSIDALSSVRRCAYAVGFFIELFLEPEDVEAVKEIIKILGREMSSAHNEVALCKSWLDAWIAKTMMLNVLLEQ